MYKLHFQCLYPKPESFSSNFKCKLKMCRYFYVQRQKAMPRTRVLLNSKAHQLIPNILRYSFFGIAGGQEVNHTFVKFVIFPITMIALLMFYVKTFEF